jgi:hypothetical protein
MSRHRSAVREPIQVYVDREDRELLEAVAARTGLARAEVLRRGLRAFAGQVLTERGPGSSLAALIGVLGEGDTPADLAARHDEYLVAYASRKRGRSRRR